MSLFNFFRKKKVDLTEDQRKWNKMWELWAEEQADAPYAQLMTYQSEINNGGHDQYFTNAENAADVQNEMSTLENSENIPFLLLSKLLFFVLSPVSPLYYKGIGQSPYP